MYYRYVRAIAIVSIMLRLSRFFRALCSFFSLIHMNHETHLDTADIYVSAYLISQGAELDGTERTPDGRVHFHLRRIEGMDKLTQVYWSNKPTSVVPAQLFSALKFLKSIIHSQS